MGPVAALLVGTAVIVAGALIVRHRQRLNASNQRVQERFFGRRLANSSGGRQAPVMMGVVGVLWMVVGAVIALNAIIAIVQGWADGDG